MLTNGAICVRVLLSRLLLHWPLQFVANHLLPDHEADAFYSIHWAPNSPANASVAQWLFGGFARWDAVHMLHIAQYGYTFETDVVFGPLFPFLISLLAGGGGEAMLLVVGVFLNLGCAMITACALHRFVMRVTDDGGIARISLLLFTVSPASIFINACYSESLYSAISFTFLAELYDKRRQGGPPSPLRCVALSLLIALSLLTRSNGFLNLGYIAFMLLLDCYRTPTVSRFVSNAITGAACLIISVVPYSVFTHQLHTMYCTPSLSPSQPIVQYAHQNSLIIRGDIEHIEFCEHSWLHMYGVVQSKHWDVSPFAYYTIVHIPLFLLAAPVMFCVYVCIRRTTFSLLLLTIHTVALSLLSLFVINVEVATRLIFSSSPLIYVVMAQLAVHNVRRRREVIPPSTTNVFADVGALYRICTDRIVRVYIIYSIVYVLVGTILHSNFYPWT